MASPGVAGLAQRAGCCWTLVPAEGAVFLERADNAPHVCKSRVALTQCACAVVSTRRKGREEGGTATVTGILYRVTLAEGRAQQDCCFLHLQGKGMSEYSSETCRRAKHFSCYFSLLLCEALCYMALKPHNALAAELQKVCPAYRVPPLKVMKATSQRDGSSRRYLIFPFGWET